jgi:hypothetical protein
VTVIETSAGAETVKTVDPEIPLNVAEMVLVPWLRLMARPLESIVATTVTEEPQVTDVEMSFVLASEKLPMAVNCCVLPSGTDGLAGVIEIVVSTGADGCCWGREPPPPPQLQTTIAVSIAAQRQNVRF